MNPGAGQQSMQADRERGASDAEVHVATEPMEVPHKKSKGGKKQKGGKKSKGGKKHKGAKARKSDKARAAGDAHGAEAHDDSPPGLLSRKEYERSLKKLHVELVHLQEWVLNQGLKVMIVFEGRDGAGKGGTIKALTERVSPRVFRVIALPAPTERERSQMYVQRYLPHFPAAGEVVIWDRSWYNRAGVERVMGFCTEAEVKHFLDAVPGVEKAMVDSGIILIKYWLEVSMEEQARRLEARIDDGRKTWKLSPMDLKSFARWYDYSRARDEMFQTTDTPWAPWYVVHSDDKKRARLNCITHMLGCISYERVPHEKVKLPKRKKDDSYVETRYPFKVVPEVF